MVSQGDLQELKDIYFKLYKRVLSDEEAMDLATRLIGLFKIIVKPLSVVDIKKEKENNGSNA